MVSIGDVILMILIVSANICGLIIAFSVADIDFTKDMNTESNKKRIVTSQNSLRGIAIIILLYCIVSFLKAYYNDIN